MFNTKDAFQERIGWLAVALQSCISGLLVGAINEYARMHILEQCGIRSFDDHDIHLTKRECFVHDSIVLVHYQRFIDRHSAVDDSLYVVVQQGEVHFAWAYTIDVLPPPSVVCVRGIDEVIILLENEGANSMFLQRF